MAVYRKHYSLISRHFVHMIAEANATIILHLRSEPLTSVANVRLVNFGAKWRLRCLCPKRTGAL